MNDYTNVVSRRFGRGEANGIGSELGSFLVTTMDLPWSIAQQRIGGEPAAVLMVESMEVETLERQLAAAPPVEAVVAVGGGQAIDLGKYIAWKRNCRLITIPTIISVDAFVTPAAAVRKNHRVEYVGSSSPDPLVIDYDLIRTAPPELNIAGVGDLLSIHTATFDWELTHQAGKDQHEFSAADIARAREILADVSRRADEIHTLSDEGIRCIVDGYIGVNTICLPRGHYRAEEGSEHFLFYELEERTKRAYVHGHIVGLGIYLMSRLQENSPAAITALMDRLGLRYHPADLGIDRTTLQESLQDLKAYSESIGLWYSILQQRHITTEWIAQAISGLKFPVTDGSYAR
jgi:glycerol-1-phosphate dehydrogenase [NAD(P)+]